MDLHNYKKQLDRQMEIIFESKEISKENKEWIFGFRDYLLSEGIGAAKIGRYMLDIRKLNRLLGKKFDLADEKDIRRVIADIEQSELAPESKKCFKIMTRKLYRFIRGITEKRVYPPEVRWISIHIPQHQRKLPEQLLTDAEIKKMIHFCESTRDKALVAVLAESGCRVSEIGLLKIKHISFEQYGARLTVNGKTGMRKILVINSMPYLQEWLNNHPKNSNPEEYVWYNPIGPCLGYAAIAKILRNCSKGAGIKKRVHPHLLRHSRATSLANVLSDAQMKNYLGWTQSSKMAGIYVHLSGKDTDSAILRANNIEIKREIPEPILEVKECAKCHFRNSSTHRFCNRCGFVLDEETSKDILVKETEQKKADNLLNDLLQDPEILCLLRKKMEKIQHANL